MSHLLWCMCVVNQYCDCDAIHMFLLMQPMESLLTGLLLLVSTHYLLVDAQGVCGCMCRVRLEYIVPNSQQILIIVLPDSGPRGYIIMSVTDVGWAPPGGAIRQ